jgi:DNA-binding CsgD family transcriptional regulator
MFSSAELSSLLEDLYGAPLEPQRWNSFLDKLCMITNSSCGYVMGAYQEEGNVILAGGGQNHDAEFFHLYSEHYGSSDPFRPGHGHPPVIGLNDGRDLIDHAVVVKTEFYNDLLLKYDMEYMTLLLSSFSASQTEGVSLWTNQKHQGTTVESQQLLEMLLPHVQTALALRRKVNSIQSLGLFSETVMDAMSVAALLVDERGRVHQMNRRVESYLVRGSGLCLSRGHLKATDSRDTPQLSKLLRGAASRNRDGALPGGAMRVARPNDGPLYVSVVPSPSENVLDGSGRYAVVFLYDQNAPQGNRSLMMRQLYQLTPVEVRMADLLCSGLTIRDAADVLRLTLETARFHVKQILRKTGVRRQAELIRLMLCLPVTS